MAAECWCELVQRTCLQSGLALAKEIRKILDQMTMYGINV